MAVTKGPSDTAPPKAAPKRRVIKTAAAAPVAAPVKPTAPVVAAKPAVVKAAPVVAEKPVVTPAPIVEPAKAKVPAPIAPVMAVAKTVAAVTAPPTPVSVKPASEAPVSDVAPPKASTPVPSTLPTFQETVKLMATLPAAPFKGYEDFAAFGKANIEAFVQANAILAKGLEEISKEMVALTKSSLETATTTAKAVMSAKSVKDAVALQTDYSKSSFGTMMTNSSKLSELSVKIASEAIAPVTARVNVTVEKFMKPAA